jgi:predicted esterase
MKRVIAVSFVLLACARTSPERAVADRPAEAPPEAPAAALAPLGGVWLEWLTRPDGSRAAVSVPLGATTRRPVIVAAHGAGDRPEWSCGGWRGVTDAYSFIVCPEGSPFGGGFAWSSVEQLDSRARMAEQALREHYSAYVDPGPAVLAAFSQGARLSAVVAARHPKRWARVALLEGGWAESAAMASGFSGGKGRVLLACSTRGCTGRFARSLAALQRARVDVRFAHLGDFGHHMGPTVTGTMRRQWRWLVRDDERWEAWLEEAADASR